MLTEREIDERFMELWNETGELLVYKSFVSMYPDYALLYDQICGSIPPSVEVEVSCSEILDNQFSECSTSVVDCCSTSNDGEANTFQQEGHTFLVNSNGYGDGPISDLFVSLTVEHLHNDSNNIENSFSGALSKQRVYSVTCDNKEVYNNTVSKEHFQCDTNNKEHLKCDTNNKEHLLSNSYKKEHVCSDNDKKEPSNCEHNSVLPSSFVKATESGEPDIMMNEDLVICSCHDENLSSFTKASDIILHAGNSPVDSAILSVDDALPLLKSAIASNSMVSIIKDSMQTTVPENSISQRNYNSGESVQMLPHEEHCYGLRQSHNHRNVVTDSGSDSMYCLDDFTVDEEVIADDHSHEELIAVLKDSHSDLRNQVYMHVRRTFSEWLRRNPDEEFDISCLDEDLVAVVSPYFETGTVCIDHMGEQ